MKTSWLKTTLRLYEKARARFSRPTARAKAPHLELGRRGERLAADYLLALGYRLVASNFRLNWGATAAAQSYRPR